jgi:hypothetical protein
MALTKVLNFYGHETSRKLQLYDSDPDFAITSQALSVGKKVPYFHLHDALLYYLGHIYVPSSDCAKTIWEARYSGVVGNFGVEKTIVILQKYFCWPKL